ncbi:MAG TPA: HEAT repeat domain-containing protein [Pyrinomonadaceae bacterium]|nr:HEAT repeat domain-containing protein [Pyrinomonadaceae bacterium]
MSNFSIIHKILPTLTVGFVFAGKLFAYQAAKPAPATDEGGGLWTWISYLLLAAGLFGLSYFLWQRSKQTQPDGEDTSDADDSQPWNSAHHVDADQEMAWFSKSKKPKKKKKVVGPKAERRSGDERRTKARPSKPRTTLASVDTVTAARAYQEKLRKYQYSQLPVHSFIQITEARPFEKLPVGYDPDLLSAIDQALDENEEEEAFREIAVKVLAKFKTRNAVEGLSQMALYDLSANIRSKAVSTLAEFDHESVFETILLACADPTREVRAAAARGLFRLNFDRAEAWKRIINTDDKFRISMAAKAAIESDILSKSIDRLIHQDMKIAYETFALVALVLKAGEAQSIIDAFKSTKDDRVRLALLHVAAVVADPDSIEAFKAVGEEGYSGEVKERLKDLAEIAEAVAV